MKLYITMVITKLDEVDLVSIAKYLFTLNIFVVSDFDRSKIILIVPDSYDQDIIDIKRRGAYKNRYIRFYRSISDRPCKRSIDIKEDPHLVCPGIKFTIWGGVVHYSPLYGCTDLRKFANLYFSSAVNTGKEIKKKLKL